MAKRQIGSGRTSLAEGTLRWESLAALAAGLLAMLFAVSTHWPADSVEVERGAAIYHCGLALLAAAAAWFAIPRLSGGAASNLPLWIDAAAWCLVGWVGLSVWANADVIQLRSAFNEWWVWVAGAACFTAARRLLIHPAARRMLVLLVIVTAGLLATHGWHQLQVSLPATAARYEREPEKVLAEAGVDHAPPGSSRRMVFENRLRDGGPTATFALTNSLAGLLIPAFLLASGLLVWQWKYLTLEARLGFFAAALLIGSLLLRTNSRSAIGAVLLVWLGWLAVAVFHSSRAVFHRSQPGRPRWSRRSWLAVLAVCLILAAGLGLYVSGNQEITERAGASLAVRLQYWRSTAALVADAPWFGCGPGNFQAAYEGYREFDASEQIADPHNFVMQTAAAGGLPAVFLLAVLGALVVRQLLRPGSGDEFSEDDTADTQHAPSAPPRVPARARNWGWGFLIGILLVWMLGSVIGRAPDYSAHLWAIPVAGLLTALLWRWLPSGRLPRPLLVGAVAGVLIHLLFAGGWTVPGVAVGLWLLGGAMLAAGDNASLAPNEGEPNGSLRDRWAVGLVAAALLGAFYWTGLRPVSEASRWMMEASVAMNVERKENAYQRAAAADPWDSAPPASLAELYRQGLLQEDHRELRRRLMAASEAARQAAPNDPSLLAFLGELRVHLFQRWGRQEDLRAGLEFYQQAAAQAPANERLAAQLAVLYGALGDEQALLWAQRARDLAAAGGHIERRLDGVTILSARFIGPRASPRPETLSAEGAMPNREPPAAVSND